MPRRSGSERLAARQARLEAHASESDPDVVMTAAARYLELRSRSVEETRRHLSAAAFPSPLIEAILERLIELGILDDRAFAQAWVESRDRSRPRGRVALLRELELKGIDRETVTTVLADRDNPHESDRDVLRDGDRRYAGSADQVAAERLLTKSRSALLRAPDWRSRRAKAYGLLARNGFDPDICREVSAKFIDSVVADADSGSDDDPTSSQDA
jgi:regulatory protein